MERLSYGGDFRQILPVIRHGTRSEVVSACLNRSPLWRSAKVMKLTINMRLQRLSSQDSFEVSEFYDFLLRVGEGTEPQNEDNMVHINERFMVRGETLADLATTIYSEIKENYQNRDDIISCIMMFPKNDTTDQINEFVMNQIPWRLKYY